MNNLFIYIFFVILAYTFVSCGDDIQNGNEIEIENNFKYPLSVNSFWYYTTKNVTVNIRPDSIKIHFNSDTLTGYGIANIIKDTIAGNDTLRILKNEYSLSGHNSITHEYYNQTDSGLIRKAYLSSGSGLGPFRNRIHFSYSGKTYNSLEEISADSRNDLQSGGSMITPDNPPKKVIRYPLEINSEWEVISNDFFKVKKKYLGYENVSVSGNSYYCMKIKRSYFFNSSEPDPNFISYDYFAKEGIVKRETIIKNINVMNELGNLIGFIDISEITKINILILP